jgi:hypothetical protein
MLDGDFLARAVGELADHGAHLVHHLGMVGAQRDVRLGVLRVEP